MNPYEIEATEVDSMDLSFRREVLEGKWEYVQRSYRNNHKYHKMKITKSRGTALHVAVNDGKLEIVNSLVGAILEHEGREVLRYDSALTKSTNERGDTPLHLAASRGFIGICKCIIGEHGERKELIRVMNNKGETPLFRAVVACQKKTFVYLHHVSKDIAVPLRNYDGDTILHRAIWGELLDLAIIITDCYPQLLDMRNKDGITPLVVLARKPSAFESGSSLPWWKKILYYCILVGPVDPKKAIESYMERVDKSEDLQHVHKVTVQLENEANEAHTVVPQNYVTFVEFVKSTVRLAFKGLDLTGLGATVPDLKALKKLKRKHKWSLQLLDVFMERPSGSYIGSKGDQQSEKHDTEENRDQTNTLDPFITPTQVAGVKEQLSKDAKEETNASGKKQQKGDDIKKEERSKETAFLAAARNGIIEIVATLQTKIPSTIHETNSNNENVLLVAVKHRQTEVVEVLRRNLDKKLFHSLILEVDNKENTVLHLAAATTSNSQRTWQIAGTAMQMMWDIKWYQYIKDQVPGHFTFRNNNDEETAWEIFEENHTVLMKDSSEWLKETSNSCSVVAALIAGVSFATSSSVPGGTDNGKPALEGQPAFDAFAISSLIGLCFSVTALIMFLSILTSRKQAQDFRRDLPFKLLFGLSSLFVSITSMLVSFCTAHFFVLKDKYKNILFPIYVATCLPVTFYAIVQFPLYFDLVKAIIQKVPQRAKN